MPSGLDAFQRGSSHHRRHHNSTSALTPNNSSHHPRSGSGSNNSTSLWTWPWNIRDQKVHSDRRLWLMLRYGGRFLMAASVGMIVVVAFYNIYSIGTALPPLQSPLQLTTTTTTTLAVLVAGSTQRFLFDSFVEHVAKPAAKQKVAVDYYAILTRKSGPAFRQADGYMGHLSGFDEGFRSVSEHLSQGSVDLATAQSAILATMKAAVASQATTTTTIRALQLLDDPIEDDPILDAVRTKEHLKYESANKKETSKQDAPTIPFDVFAQFPMMDHREKALARTLAGNKNMIRLFLALERVWKTGLLAQESVSNKLYDYVLILRDDALWLDDFDLRKVIATDPTADAYVLSCDGRSPKMLPPEINDHGILVKRSKADVVGEYVTTMASLNLQECHDSVTEFVGKNRGCNSEMILKHVLEKNSVKTKLVPQSLLPFERAVRIADTTKNDYYCYHKFCQSVQEPLQLPKDIQKCKELEFPA